MNPQRAEWKYGSTYQFSHEGEAAAARGDVTMSNNGNSWKPGRNLPRITDVFVWELQGQEE